MATSDVSGVSGVDSQTALSKYIAQQKAAATAAETAKASSPGTATSISKITGDFNTFLKILTAQLQNQDPMNATDPNEFTRELVQFSAVEQQINTNSKLDTLSSLIKGNGITPLLDYVGKSVEVPSNDQLLVQGGQAALSYNLPAIAHEVSITVEDSSGTTLATMSGPKTSGVNRVAWDGVKTDGTQATDGLYALKIIAKDVNGNKLAVDDINRVSVVTGVQTDSDGTVTLLTGNTSVKTTDIKAVYNGVSTAS
jgi:flagellar basal-body rod modification protein FlgD